MAIVSSEIIEQHPQTDGRTQVRERHVDHLAKEYIIDYTAHENADLNAMLAQHANDLWNQLIWIEIQSFVYKLEDGTLPSPGVIINNYAQKIDILKALVKRAMRMKALDAAYKAIVLMNWIKENYNNTQIAAFLGVNVTVVQAVMNRFADLESKIKPLLDIDETKIVEID